MLWQPRCHHVRRWVIVPLEIFVAKPAKQVWDVFITWSLHHTRTMIMVLSHSNDNMHGSCQMIVQNPKVQKTYLIRDGQYGRHSVTLTRGSKGTWFPLFKGHILANHIEKYAVMHYLCIIYYYLATYNQHHNSILRWKWHHILYLIQLIGIVDPLKILSA